MLDKRQECLGSLGASSQSSIMSDSITWTPLEAAFDETNRQWYVLLYRVREKGGGDRHEFRTIRGDATTEFGITEHKEGERLNVTGGREL